MDVFKDYGTYYDLLYADKNYKEEADYVLDLVKGLIEKPKTLLDLGCGTGKHAKQFVENGLEVTGIDQSDTMLELAKQNEPKAKFLEGNIAELKLEKEFDVVTSLFHVMSYQTTNEVLENTFSSTAKHIKPNGAFLFDCWYGPAVLADKPYSRKKEFENEQLKIERTSIPFMDEPNNTVRINYTIEILDKKANKKYTIKENHKMRYLFDEEIEKLFLKNGLELKINEQWLTGKPLGKNTWYATFGGVKNG